MRQDKVAAADHQRAPHDQHGDLAHGNVFQRPGVKKHKECPQPEQNPDGQIVAVRKDQIQAAHQRQESRYPKIGQVLALGHQSIRHRLGPVHCAVVVVLIHPARIIGIIVENIIGSMRQHQPERQDEPGKNINLIAVMPGKKSGQ